MSLPKVDLPTYKHYMYGIEKNVTYRPFTNKERKILLLAKEASENGDKVEPIIDAIKQIIGLCVIDDIDPDDLPMFDIEEIFLRIYSVSVGNKVDVAYRFKFKDSENQEKEEVRKHQIDLDTVKLDIQESHSKKIMVHENLGIMMKYPSLKNVMATNGEANESVVMECIDYIFDQENVYKDFTDEDIEEFYDSLDIATMAKITEFFNTMPRIRQRLVFKLSNNEERSITLEGIEDFFM